MRREHRPLAESTRRASCRQWPTRYRRNSGGGEAGLLIHVIGLDACKQSLATGIQSASRRLARLVPGSKPNFSGVHGVACRSSEKAVLKRGQPS